MAVEKHRPLSPTRRRLKKPEGSDLQLVQTTFFQGSRQSSCFSADETCESVDLDGYYEGSDIIEEMWSGFWEITSVMDGSSFVTISLSLVSGENCGVTDSPYYISETYPLVISPNGEEMVMGAGSVSHLCRSTNLSCAC